MEREQLRRAHVDPQSADSTSWILVLTGPSRKATSALLRRRLHCCRHHLPRFVSFAALFWLSAHLPLGRSELPFHILKKRRRRVKRSYQDDNNARLLELMAGVAVVCCKRQPSLVVTNLPRSFSHCPNVRRTAWLFFPTLLSTALFPHTQTHFTLVRLSISFFFLFFFFFTFLLVSLALPSFGTRIHTLVLWPYLTIHSNQLASSLFALAPF